MSSISITGSVIDPVDRLGEASESRIAVPLGTIDSLLRELSRGPPADMRPAAELRSAVDAASALSAGPSVIGPALGPNNVVPRRAVEQPVLGGPIATAGVARGISQTGRIVDPADRRSEASGPGTIDSLLRDLSRDPPADTRLAAQLRSAVDAASAPSGVIGLSAAPTASAAPALQPAEDPVLKELDKLIARLDAGTAGLPLSHRPSRSRANSSAEPSPHGNKSQRERRQCPR